MSQFQTNLSNKLILRRYADDCILHEHWCPGCDYMHCIAVEQPFRNGARWTYDGNHEVPTFSPSINIDSGSDRQCHYFIKAGNIEFCADSKHALAGQTVPLPDIPDYQLNYKG